MNFIPLTPDLASEWDQVVIGSDDAWLFHCYDWLMIEKDIWEMEPFSFLVEENGQFVGIFPLEKYKNRNILRSTVRGDGGAALINDIGFSARKRILKGMHNHLEDLARRLGVEKIEVSISPLSRSSLNNPWQVNPLVEYFYRDTSTHTWIVDLSKTSEELLRHLSDDAQRAVKKAKEAGYTVEAVSSLEGIEEYYEVHRANCERNHIPPYPKDYFLRLYQDLITKGKAVVWKALSPDKKCAAFEIIALFKRGAFYWSGCAKAEHLSKGANYLLQFNSMLWAKTQGALWFDNGEAFPNIRAGKERGLTLFKSKFGGELHRLYRGRFILEEPVRENTHLKRWLSLTAKLLQPVFGAGLIKKGGDFALKIYRGARKILAYFKSWRRIYFLKHFWSTREILLSFFAPAAEEKTAAKLCAKIKKILNTDGILVPAASGRTALKLALKVLKKKFPLKTYVIFPSYACKAIYDAVIETGLSPLLADINEDLNLSVDSVKNILKSEENILAVIVPHLGGCAAPIAEIAKLARGKDIVVIEDAAQAFGLKIDGMLTGTRYGMSIFSFGIGKNLMASAGGFLWSNTFQKEIEEEAEKLGREQDENVKKRFQIYLKQYFLHLKGDDTPFIQSAHEYNALHPFDARLILSQLDKLDTIITRRRENAKKIIAALQKTPLHYLLPSDPGHIYTKLSVIFKNRDDYYALTKSLSAAGIQTEEMYTPLHLRGLTPSAFSPCSLSMSERLYKYVLNIPARPNLTLRELHKITRAIEGVKSRENRED